MKKRKKTKKKTQHHIKVVVERHPDGYVAYPIRGIKGGVVGQGRTYEEALADVQSAIRFHIDTFGSEVVEMDDDQPLESFLAETVVAV
jgi:predicted RNase H-like HicB family nuclease